ncbi:GntR family transcriptional regulator [Leucobacter iarius]|uniref:HTH gntR-type domain-containing protein n=1 Tax=Leucobacter iarius TaxID=333963 RepID=A0ABN2LU69_9MICO
MASWELTTAADESLVSGTPPSGAPLQHRRLLRQDVYEMLLRELINGALAPGQRIRDDELAQRLNVSRTPVREALARLGTAGLVDTAPNRYTRVTPLFSPDLPVVLESLAALYQLALRRAATALTAGDELELEVLARKLDEAARPDPFLVVQAFGRFCAERVASPILSQLIAIAQPRLQRILRLQPQILASVDTIDAVVDLVDALRARDEQRAEQRFIEFFDRLSTEIHASPLGNAG